jgi:exosortase
MKKADSIKLWTLVILTATAYIPTFIWMYDRWVAHDTYYNHGFLVPLISLFLVWLKRDSLSKIEIKPAKLGWLFFLSGIIAHLLSALVRVYFTSGFSLVVMLVGLVLLFFGKKILRQVLFPIFFLVFMVPAPLVAISNMSFRLKIFASQVSTKIINMLGVPAIREGSIIRTMHSQMIVEDPCSGIRSLIALIALGSLMAYFSNISKAKKTILFLSSMPIAIATNIIRIVALSLASEMYGTKFAMGWFHDTMGILVFVFAFFGLSLVAKLLE